MRKLILVLDDPEYCAYCTCVDEEKSYCQAAYRSIEDLFDGRPAWCPLKELPKEKYYDLI